jgi:prophage antirepressor-like protein
MKVTVKYENAEKTLPNYIISIRDYFHIHDHQEDTDVKCYLRWDYASNIAEVLLQNIIVHSATPAAKRWVILTILNSIRSFGQAKSKPNI